MTSALLDMPTEIHIPASTPGALQRLDRIVLTGFMGSGKTTVGAALAARLGWTFVDLDREIERREAISGAPRSVPEIFAQSGEAHFRRLESTALASLLGQHRLVLALGGGAPESLGNRLLLEQTPRTAVVYLSAPLETLLGRCASDAALPNAIHRPVLAQADARFLIRHPLYARLAHHTILTARLDIEATTDAVLEALQSRS
jgi:shikimate kinase